MSAWRRIYSAAGTWNDHTHRIKTIAWWLLIAGALVVFVGGFLVRTYGWLGAIAISVGGLLLVCAACAFVIDRTPRRTKPIQVDTASVGGAIADYEMTKAARHAAGIEVLVDQLKGSSPGVSGFPDLRVHVNALYSEPINETPGWTKQTVEVVITNRTTALRNLQFVLGIVTDDGSFQLWLEHWRDGRTPLKGKHPPFRIDGEDTRQAALEFMYRDIDVAPFPPSLHARRNFRLKIQDALSETERIFEVDPT